MTRIDSPWDLPDKTVARAATADREIRISDFALMATLALRTETVRGLPLNELTMAVLVGLCLFRPARGGARLPAAVSLLMGALLALLLFSGVANDVEWTRRVGHVAVLAGLIWSFGTGRVSLRSAASGLAVGIIGVIGLALAGIGGDTYPGRLTGFLGDPNAGAYFIVVLGILAVFFCDDRWKVRLVVAAPVLAGLVLTYSRTGLLAGAACIVWLVLGRRLGAIGVVAMAGGLVWMVANIPQELKLFGPFSNRSGSDELRERIVAREHDLLAQAPWYGHGPGSARVTLGDNEFFFHNSYLAVRQEGGWLLLVLVLALMAVAFMSLSPRSQAGDMRAVAAQAALIGTLAMSVTLGEVLLELPTALAIGFALAHAGSRTTTGRAGPVTRVTNSTLPK